MRETEIDMKVKPRVRMTDEIRKQFVEGELGAVLDWQVTDKEGKITSEGIRKAESFVRQFMDLLLIKFINSSMIGSIPVRDITNTLQDTSDSSSNFSTDAPTSNVSYGIIVGTGTTDPNITDYKIETIIAHGTSAGQLQYGAVTYGLPASDSTTSQFTITRNFANASGGAITVNEIALYVKANVSAVWDIVLTVVIPSYFMTIRDKISGGISVPNGQTLTINYRPQAIV
jgi:hypothetical protein